VAGRCLRCGRRPAKTGWQCASCEASFPDREADRTEGLPFLEEQARLLARAADRLDGAGFWAASQTAWRAVEKVEELKQAIADDKTPERST
jgi:hypothetical protein